jgi:flagellar biosynthesis protein FlhF
VAEVLHDTFLCPTELRLTGNPRVIALVGPSGAGKTTTAAKLAGHLSLARGARVVLISTDVHRIGAFPQLQALGELMQVPVLTALTPSDALAKVRQARREHDVVIIDTPACSGPGPVWESLLDTLIAVEPEELLLTLAANTKPSDVQRTARHYGATLPLGGVVVTKLDESGDPGILVNVAWRFQTPVVWLGTGPDIPADLEAATPQQLVNRVWSTRLAAHAEVGS